MDNLEPESKTVTIPAVLLGGGELAAEPGSPVTVTIKGKLLSTDDGMAIIELENDNETEAENPMSERNRVRGMGETADLEDF